MVRPLKTAESEEPYLKLMKPRDVNHVGRTPLVSNSIRTTTTFPTEACGEVFKIQRGPLNCNSEKVLYLFKCKVVCGEAPYLGKAKTKFRHSFNNYKSKHSAIELSRKEKEKYPRNVFMIIIVWIII